MFDRLFDFTINFDWCIHEIDKAIERVRHCTFKRIFNWNNTIVSLSSLYKTEYILNSWFVDVIHMAPKSCLGCNMCVGFFRT